MGLGFSTNQLDQFYGTLPEEKTMSEQKKAEFWKKYDEHVSEKKSAFDKTDSYNFQKSRVEEADKLIKGSPVMKESFEKYPDYAEQTWDMSFDDLIKEIQPRWSSRNSDSLNEVHGTLMCIAMMEYRLRGLDMEYFTSGAGY